MNTNEPLFFAASQLPLTFYTADKFTASLYTDWGINTRVSYQYRYRQGSVAVVTMLYKKPSCR